MIACKAILRSIAFALILLWTCVSYGQQTSSYLTKFSTPPSIINSVLFESGGKIGLGTTTPTYRFDAIGSGDEKIRIQSSGAGFGSAIMFWNTANTNAPRMEWQM